MRHRLLALCALFALFLAGCTLAPAKNGEVNSSSTGSAAASSSEIKLPASIDYTATYSITEDGGEISETVWRKNDAMRMQYATSGKVFMDLFFISGHAYSCTGWKAQPECFDISGNAGGQMKDLFAEPDFSSAEPSEEVDIGSTKGKCYVFPYTVQSTRKMCFTDRGVVAYDEYIVAGGKPRVEYLTGITYSANDSSFLLPAAPVAAPGEPQQ